MSAIGPYRTFLVAPHMSAFMGKAEIGQRRVAAYDRKVRPQEISKTHLAMQSFMNLFQFRNLIFCARACFLQLDHFLRPSSCLIRDFSAPLSTKGAGEKTEGGVLCKCNTADKDSGNKDCESKQLEHLYIEILFCEPNSLSTTHACVNGYAAAVKRT